MNKLYEEFLENIDHNRNNITTVENLACYLAIVTCSRIQNILSASYSFKKSQTDMYELTQEDLKCYGNWSTRDCLSSSYLKSCSLFKVCKFWTDITD